MVAIKKKKKKKTIDITMPKRYSIKKRLVHIHLHTIYSIADALGKPKDLVKRAADLGMDTICVTDHGNISSIIQMKKECDKYRIKLIPGCEMYESPDRLVKDPTLSQKNNFHITMLPVNNDGWEALKFLIADANKNGMYYNPRTDMKVIEDNGLGKNIIATSGCLGSYTSKMLMEGDYDGAKAEVVRRSKIFHSYFLEVQDNGSREQEIVNQLLVQMSQETGIPLVYAKDVHYVHPQDKDAHHTMIASSRKQTIYDCNPYPGTNTYHVSDFDEVYDWALQNNIPLEAIENTGKIADMCNVKIETGLDLMPEYPFVAEGHSIPTYLKKLLYDNLIEYVEKLRKSGKTVNLKTYIDRIETEYKIITSKKFPSYFLILWDIIGWSVDRKKWASYPQNRAWLDKEVVITKGKEREDGKFVLEKTIEKPNAKYELYPEFFVGPGRGSAAGSLMAFLLGITRIDPLEYGLMFERFLNPYRDSPPDCYLNVA